MARNIVVMFTLWRGVFLHRRRLGSRSKYSNLEDSRQPHCRELSVLKVCIDVAFQPT